MPIMAYRFAPTLLLALTLLAACQSSSSTTQPLSPVAGELRVANNTDEEICHLYVEPLTQPDRSFDLIEDRGENPIKPHSNRRFLPENTPILNVNAPYSVEAEACNGATSSTFEFSFTNGGVFTINTF